MKSISVSTLKARMNSESKSQVKESYVIILEKRSALLNQILTFPEPATPAFCFHTDGIRTRRIDYRSLRFTNLLNLQADQQEYILESILEIKQYLTKGCVGCCTMIVSRLAGAIE
jgi:hypothetical protein